MTHSPLGYAGITVMEGPTAQLSVNHNGEDLLFSPFEYGPSIEQNLYKAIDNDNLGRPTIGELASLIHAAYRSPEDNMHGKKIKNDFESGIIWGFTGALYVPDEGVFFQDNPEMGGGRTPIMEKDALEQKLAANDPSVRYVPFGYKDYGITVSERSEHPFVIGLAGEEGAEKLAEISGKLFVDGIPWNHYVMTPGDPNTSEATLSAISGSRMFSNSFVFTMNAFMYSGKSFGVMRNQG